MENHPSRTFGSAAWKLKLIEDWGGYDSTIEASRVDQRAQTWDGKEEYSSILGLICLPNE